MKTLVTKLKDELDSAYDKAVSLGPSWEQVLQPIKQDLKVTSGIALGWKGVMVFSFICSTNTCCDTVPGAQHSVGNKSSPLHSGPSYSTQGVRDNRQGNQQDNSRMLDMIKEMKRAMRWRVWGWERGIYNLDRLRQRMLNLYKLSLWTQWGGWDP